jgi:hypothetical protein
MSTEDEDPIGGLPFAQELRAARQRITALEAERDAANRAATDECKLRVDIADHAENLTRALQAAREALEAIAVVETRGDRGVCVRCNLSVEHCDRNFIKGNDGCLARLARRALKAMGTPAEPTPPRCGDEWPGQPGRMHYCSQACNDAGEHEAATPAAPMCKTCGGDGVCRCDYCIAKGRTDEPCPTCHPTTPTPTEEPTRDQTVGPYGDRTDEAAGLVRGWPIQAIKDPRIVKPAGSTDAAEEHVAAYREWLKTQPAAYHDKGECEICDKRRGPIPEPTEDR